MNPPDTNRHNGLEEANPANGARSNGEAALARIGEALRGLRYGSVLAIVQDGIVIQIERTEKTRLDRPQSSEQRAR